MTENSRLKKSIGVQAYNRPVKVAYLVPTLDDTRTHWILDAIFYESYTRWGGANTLVVPTKADGFDAEGYASWLRAFDPDFIYSYVELEQAFIKKIASACLPISFLLRPKRRNDSPETRWRDLSPDWGHYFNSVKSLSTLLSPYANPVRFNRPPPTAVKTILTQSIEPSDERFFPDNFGVSHDVSMVTHAVPGLYETLCYVAPEPPGSRTVHGTREVQSIPEILAEIANGSVYTFATLARVHTDGINRVEPYSWGHGFLLFVGETCKDRINFWNSRLLAPRWIDSPGSLLVKKSAFEDESFVTALGSYLNKFNFSRGGGGPATVELRSLSESRDELAKIPGKFNRKTWNQLSIPTNFNALACPTEKEVKEAHFARRSPIGFRLAENKNEIQADPPAHFEYNIGAFSYLNDGAWAVDLDIERHNNLSKYSNVTDSWQLPRNMNVCAAFTDRLSKVTNDHLLTVIPAGRDHLWGQQHQDRRRTYELRLPTDLQFFRHLVVGEHPRDPRDLRHGQDKPRYVGLGHSDKGQNLRGVISMFDRFEETYLVLTNKLWRDALRKFAGASSVKESELHGLIPGDRDFKQEYSEKYQVDRSVVTKYLKVALSDSLEYLVKRSVLFQIHKWRCDYCGHINAKAIDDLKKENACTICRTKYFTPIDVAWDFKFNSFVAECLASRNGLTVLWALGHLHQSLFRGSFYYLPEANLYYEVNGQELREEIDILSIGNGQFLVGEVKKSATSFLRKDGDIAKFVAKVKSLKPDIALLLFEDFAENPAEAEQVKIELSNARELILRETGIERSGLCIVVASETRDFNEYDRNFGVYGPRLEEILTKE